LTDTRNLIFSIPIKFGLSREDSADVFQAVCADLVAGLPRLREPKALPKWLMQTTFHQCLRWKKDRMVLMDDVDEMDRQADPASEVVAGGNAVSAPKRAGVRDAIRSLSPRCGRMMQMLFFRNSGTSLSRSG